MRNQLVIGLLVVAAGLHVPHGVSAQQMNSTFCTVQATVISRVTVHTATTQEVSLSQPQNKRTALILSGEGVLQLNVDTSEPVETTIVELKQQAKEIKQNGFAKIKKMRLEYLSS